MNTHTPPPGNDAAEREWQAQERAVERERAGLDPAGDDARVLRYRVLARALKQPPEQALPADFAQRIARQVELSTANKASADPGFERYLQRILVAVLMVGSIVVAASHAREWLPSFTAAMPMAVLTNPWLLAFACCVGLSQGIAHWQQRVH
ncbi:hypothetical protein SAMN05216570_0614 [Dyella sp. OK004]|uniref:hypothetical protein n=1 Tax=Dyella sp. OK004 TaxID=1855292 RepID=UPI0008F1B90C|nr:hypothetical protein [Dyella sp. OK004]SFR91858.1 hypothetical protein SAMN05216570_0614 [Dyella sp. OK004]